MRTWLYEHFLPMWAKETVLAENRQLREELRQAKRKQETLQAYIRGLEQAARMGRRIYIGGQK